MGAARQATSALSPELRRWAGEIERIARGHGLDFHELDFRLLDAEDLNGVAAYGGFPVRYPSWRFGMEYERLSKAHAWGLSRIYELVINTDPVVAYLVRSNSLGEQKLVIAHVCGHADFFRHNAWFAATDRGMLDRMADHAERVRLAIERHGLERVERFIDLALSLETLVDPYQSLRAALSRGGPAQSVGTPTYDVLGFLVERAPLEGWQADLLAQVRAESLYFQPQRMTRIVNEGWASFWHSRILTGDVLDSSEIVDFADCHSGATQQGPGRMNPYKLGIELWRHAERQGQDLFALRRIHNDASFLDAFADEEFIERQQLFLHQRSARTGKPEVADRDPTRVRARLLTELAWGGLPRIELVGSDGGELHLVHRHDGRDLELGKAADTLLRLHELWGGPVRIDTREGGRGKQLRCEGGEVSSEDTDDAAELEAPRA